jgi:hypothetical protein
MPAQAGNKENTGLEKIQDFNTALAKALPDTFKFRTEVQLITKSFEFLNNRLGEGFEELNKLQTMQAALNKTLGKDGFDAVNNISDAFVKLNQAMRGIEEANIQGAFEGIRKSFALTNKEIVEQAGSTAKLKKAMDEASKSIAKNSNVIDQSKLVDFTNKFTFQTNSAVDTSEKFGERLVGLAYRLGLPNEQLLTLGQNMLSTGNYFGEINGKIEEATLKATAFGRALGTTGDVVNKQLASMQTISGRQQLAARLSQIGSMVGVDIDISKLMSADPDEQRQGLRDALRKFSSSSKNLTAAQQRALSLSLSTALPSFGREAIQTALVRGVDIEDAQKKIDAAKDDVKKGAITEEMRRRATTFEKMRAQFIAAERRPVANKQLEAIGKDFNSASDKFTNAVIGFSKTADNLAAAIGAKEGIKEITEILAPLVKLAKENITNEAVVKALSLAGLSLGYQAVKPQTK